jgi:hypothetical protein
MESKKDFSENSKDIRLKKTESMSSKDMGVREKQIPNSD